MADYFDAGKFGAIVAIPFSNADCTTGESATDMALAGSGTLFVAPVGGSVIGVSIRSNASLTAGTIIATPHAASTEFADVGVPQPTCSSSAQASYATVAPGKCTFAAGGTLGISITTTTTLDPTNSADVDAFLFVALNPS